MATGTWDFNQQPTARSPQAHKPTGHRSQAENKLDQNPREHDLESAISTDLKEKQALSSTEYRPIGLEGWGVLGY